MTPARIRLLNVLPTLLCGGTENQVTTLSTALADRFELEVACMRRTGPFVSELDDRHIPVQEYPITSFWNPGTLGQQTRFATRLVSHETQIVHTYSFYGNVFAIPPAAVAGVPVIIASVRDRGPYLTSLQKRVQRYVCHLADRIVVNAEAVRDWLVAQGYPREKIVVIHNGVDLKRFSGPADAEAVRRQLGVAPGQPMVTVVSRLSRLKGLEQFIDAAALLARRFPKVRFLIVGAPSLEEKAFLLHLEKLARDRGVDDRILFTGMRFDVPAILGSAAVVVMPSLNEALSNVLLEAMAAGAPIVATRVGGTPEAVVDGETGVLVRPGDSVALAGAIARLLNDPARAAAIGCAARRAVEAHFSLSRMVAATEELYLDLLARKTRRRAFKDAGRSATVAASTQARH